MWNTFANRSRQVALVAASAMLAACGRDMSAPSAVTSRRDATPEDVHGMQVVVETGGAGAAQTSARIGQVVASVPGANGGSVTFVDMGDEIAIGEITPVGAPMLARSLIERYSATPLEVFRALSAGEARAPEPLLRDHRRRLGGEQAARAFAADGVSALGLGTPGLDPTFTQCDGMWKPGWSQAFAAKTKYQASVLYHGFGLAGALLFYPGSHVYYGTNTNTKTYLGACNGVSYGPGSPLNVQIHRRISGSWVVVHQVSLQNEQMYTFYSGLPASYRGRADAPSPLFLAGMAAAWTPSPVLGS